MTAREHCMVAAVIAAVALGLIAAALVWPNQLGWILAVITAGWAGWETSSWRCALLREHEAAAYRAERVAAGLPVTEQRGPFL